MPLFCTLYFNRMVLVFVFKSDGMDPLKIFPAKE